ncbi:MAG: PQQ-binding-like beta-propeller repeat protein [Gemmataceae bacterium]
MNRYTLLGVSLLIAPVFAADWPQWLGPRRDCVSTETIKPWKGELKVLWRQPIGPGHSSPVVANGKVYLHARVPGKEEEVLTAFEATDGKVLWKSSYPRAKFWTLFGTGPQATPTVADGKVFTYGATGILSAFDTSTGELVWQIDTEKEFQVKRPGFGAACSPLVDGKNVVVNIGGKKGSIVAFDVNKGEVTWKALDDPASYSSGIRIGEQLVFLTQRGVRGLAPADGKLLWEYRLIDKLDESATTPVAVGDWLLVTSITQGMVGLKRQADGTYKEAWINKEITCYFSTPVPVGDHFYAVTGKLGLGVTSTLHCVETATGKIKWSKPRVGTYHAAMLRTADDKLLFLSDFGDLLLLQPDPKEYKELARGKVTKNDGIWAHPALADGRVYLRDDKELICVAMPK